MASPYKYDADADALSEASIAPPSPWQLGRGLGCRHDATAHRSPAYSNLQHPLR